MNQVAKSIGPARNASIVAFAVVLLSACSTAASSAQVSHATSPTAFPSSHIPASVTVQAPDQGAGSAMGYYEPGGYPILVNQQTSSSDPLAGFNTWKWNGSAWAQLVHGAGSPYAGSSMAFDPATGITVVMAGRGSGTMGWNGSAWIDLNPTSVPTSNSSQQYLTFDAKRNRLILLGDSTSAKAATWAYDGHKWTLAASTGPRWQWNAALSYDPRSGTVLLVGGCFVSVGCRYSETWTWDGASWTQLHPAT
jgi:hypothetical protein